MRDKKAIKMAVGIKKLKEMRNDSKTEVADMFLYSMTYGNERLTQKEKEQIAMYLYTHSTHTAWGIGI